MTILPDPQTLADAGTFLQLLGDRHTFLTFGEGAAKGRRGLTRPLHGTFAEHADTLAELNARGAGVFVMVNAGDSKGRKSTNVRSVRALFIDLDGAPLEAVRTGPLAPHCIVESSPDRWHAYWLVTDCSLSDFKPLQKALAARFNGDASVSDLPRVMRVPGFDHRKAKPFRTRIVEIRTGSACSVAEFRTAFGLAYASAPTTTPRAALERIPQGQRNAALFSLARGFVQKGIDAAGVRDRLQKINAEKCDPPLCASEVDLVAANASAYGSERFFIVSHKLFDSSEFKRLRSASREIVFTALRRFNGSNNGNITLTHADCRDIQGCADEDAFIGHRARAVTSGILIVAEQGRMTRHGKTPNLYALAPAYLHQSHTPQNTGLAHTPRNTGSYINKQYRGSSGVATVATLARKRRKAA